MLDHSGEANAYGVAALPCDPILPPPCCVTLTLLGSASGQSISITVNNKPNMVAKDKISSKRKHLPRAKT